MEFIELFKKISPYLKRIAYEAKKVHPECGLSFDGDDFFQEMSLYLWEWYKKEEFSNYNLSYLVKGCRFFLSNYLRTRRPRVNHRSLEELFDKGEEIRLEGIFKKEPKEEQEKIDRSFTIFQIKNNGLKEKERRIFSLLLEGFSLREIAGLLGISHVMVLKYKKRIVRKYREKIFFDKVTKGEGFLLFK